MQTRCWKIGPWKIPVSWSKTSPKRRNYAGFYTENPAPRIELNPEIKGTLMECSTEIHEIIHAFCAHLGIDDSGEKKEQRIRAMEGAILQFLQENGPAVRRLISSISRKSDLH